MTHKNIYPVFLLLLFVSFCYIFTNHYYFLYYFIDGPFHLSAIREISRHFPPRSPVVHMEGIPDYHYNISIVFQAILLKITGSIHLTVLISGAIFSAATIGSFALFARKYVENNYELLVLLLITLFCWGPYHVIWAGTYSISGLMINGFYSQTAAYVFFLMALYLAGLERQNNRVRFVTLLLISCCLIQHMLTACVLIFLYFFVEIDRLERFGKWRWKQIFPSILIVLTSILLAAFWPFYNTFNLFIEAIEMSMPVSLALVFLYPAYYLLLKKIPCITKKLREGRLKIVLICEYVLAGLVLAAASQVLSPVYIDNIMPAQDFRTFNPLDILILVGLFFFIGFLKGFSRKTSFVYLWALSLFIAACLLWWVGKGLSWRLLLISMFPLGILSALALIRMRANGARIMLTGAALFLVYSNFQFAQIYFANDHHEDLLTLAENIPQDAIVLSDPRTSYLLAGIGDREVIVSFAAHWGHGVEKGQRLKDVSIFFEPGIDMKNRLEILKKYSITHVVLSRGVYSFDGCKYSFSEDVAEELRQMLKPVGIGGSYSLFQYEPYK